MMGNLRDIAKKPKPEKEVPPALPHEKPELNRFVEGAWHSHFAGRGPPRG
jgi:hypothetical protein